MSGARTVAPAVVSLAALTALATEGLALVAGSRTAVLAAGVLAGISLLVVARASLAKLALGSAVLASFTLSWNGWLIGSVRPGDLLVLVALILFVLRGAGSAFPHLPRWLTQLGAVVVVIAVAHVLAPTDPRYLAARVVLAADGSPVLESQGNLTIAGKYLVAVVALPLVFAFTVRLHRNAARWLAVAFAAGVSVSGLVAFSDGQGLTTLGQSVTGNHNLLSREGGLSNHPNFLAAGCVVALPIVIWQLACTDRRMRDAGLVILPGVVLGMYASGSRGGAVCLVLGAVVTIALIPRFRRHLPSIALLAVMVVLVTVVLFPAFGADILRATRLSGSSDTAGSNAVRALVGAQGVRDLLYSPIDGVGFQVAAEAQNVYLQELAAGGLALFAAMLIFTLGGMRAAWLLRGRDSLSYALLASAIAGAALNFVGADLTDRFFYVPIAIVAALTSAHRFEDPGSATRPVTALARVRLRPQAESEPDLPSRPVSARVMQHRRSLR
jgi:hypothetical protein